MVTKPSSVALEHVTRGTYQREIADMSGQAWNVATEVDLGIVSDSILASGKDEMFSWIRGQLWIYSAAAGYGFEWMLYRCLTADALTDMNDESDMEYLFKEKKIFARGMLANSAPDYGLKMLKFELFNVKLSDGEEIRLLMRPIATVADGAVKGAVEYRKIGG